MPNNKYIQAAGKTTSFLTQHVLRRRPALAYVGGWLGEQNLGDELLFDATEVLFNHGLWHFNGGALSNRLYGMAPRRAGGILGGGTLIGQLPKWLNIAKSFQVHGDPFAVIGTGVADPHFWPDGTPLSEWKPVLNSCPLVGVRGPMSAEYLTDAGIENVDVVGDPAVVFTRDEPNSNFEQGVLALNFGRAHERMWGTAENVRDEMAKLATLAKNAGWKVVWLVVFPGDLEITMEAAEVSHTTEHVEIIYHDYNHFMDVVGKASVMVGMKLHATILATCALTPSIMLEYRQKCRDYMQSIDHDEYVITTGDFLADPCWERIQEMDRERMTLSRKLEKEMRALKSKLIKSASLAENIFHST
ncbi:MAG: polysaccharide pyruvyl transferase family protein [Opitutales bacterium]|nr:polysaccharide pyruvyl transferase family protein [Opitutales bacterium]